MSLVFLAPALELDNTLGAALVGAVLGTFLFGIASLQTFHYYRIYEEDSWRLKALVTAVWLIELGHTIALWHALYQMSVSYYGQIEHILDPPHSLPITVLFASLINVIVQSYFVFRIQILSKRWLIPAICSILTVARFAVHIIMLIKFLDSTGFAIFHTEFHWLMLCVSILGPLVDVLIASSLCYYLWKMKNEESSFEQTCQMIDTLMLWSIETTSMTSAAGVLQLITYLSMPNNLIWIAFFLLQPKLFSNSLLAHLNGRDRFRIGGGKVNTDDSLRWVADPGTTGLHFERVESTRELSSHSNSRNPGLL